MNSYIRINKICQHCGKEFEARKTTTKTCSDACAKLSYKGRLRSNKIEIIERTAMQAKIKPMEDLKQQEFLTVKDVAKLLHCSIRTTYYLIESGKIKAVNLAQRKTLIKRSDIDKLFV